MKKLLLLTTLLVASVDVNAGGLTAKSLEALQNYCVYSPSTPAPDGDCSGIFEGVRKAKGDCRCHNSKYLVWDAGLRRCKPKCPGGYYVQTIKSTNCAAGQYKLKVSK